MKIAIDQIDNTAELAFTSFNDGYNNHIIMRGVK